MMCVCGSGGRQGYQSSRRSGGAAGRQQQRSSREAGEGGEELRERGGAAPCAESYAHNSAKDFTALREGDEEAEAEDEEDEDEDEDGLAGDVWCCTGIGRDLVHRQRHKTRKYRNRKARNGV